jgi:hypothetical protein
MDFLPMSNELIKMVLKLDKLFQISCQSLNLQKTPHYNQQLSIFSSLSHQQKINSSKEDLAGKSIPKPNKSIILHITLYQQLKDLLKNLLNFLLSNNRKSRNQ